MSQDLARHAATARAGQIRAGIHNYLQTLALIAQAWQENDWRTLGYADWSTYVDAEFGEERLRLPREHRQKAVEELRLAGMSQRAIAATVGASQDTVRRDLAEDHVNDSVHVASIRGTDGKAYPSARPPIAEAMAAAIDKAAAVAQQKAEIRASYEGVRENLSQIPPERIAQIEREIGPTVNLRSVAEACRALTGRLRAIDLESLERADNEPDNLAAIDEAYDLLSHIQQITGALA